MEPGVNDRVHNLRLFSKLANLLLATLALGGSNKS